MQIAELADSMSEALEESSSSSRCGCTEDDGCGEWQERAALSGPSEDDEWSDVAALKAYQEGDKE